MYFEKRNATTGTGDFLADPLEDCWRNFMVAIYASCVDDLAEGASQHDQATAKAFLKLNPYGLNCDFDYLIEKKKEMLKKCK